MHPISNKYPLSCSCVMPFFSPTAALYRLFC
jgi:hypothetical protein